jgi:hypothetical protein
VGRSRLDPITQSFGCLSTLVRNAFVSQARFENSAAVYTAGLTCRWRVCATIHHVHSILSGRDVGHAMRELAYRR